ncbi:MAG: hypothetical protein ACKOSO_05770, partial [Actinomycetota bacterium]
MSPARRLIIPLVPLALLVAAGSAWGAQDIGTADPSRTITVEVDVPPLDAGTRPGVTGEDRRSTLRITFTDMNGDERTVSVLGPDPGAQKATVTYGGTWVLAPDDAGANVAKQPTMWIRCPEGDWDG